MTTEENAKGPDDLTLAMLQRYASGATHRAISEEFECHKNTVFKRLKKFPELHKEAKHQLYLIKKSKTARVGASALEIQGKIVDENLTLLSKAPKMERRLKFLDAKLIEVDHEYGKKDLNLKEQLARHKFAREASHIRKKLAEVQLIKGRLTDFAKVYEKAENSVLLMEGKATQIIENPEVTTLAQLKAMIQEVEDAGSGLDHESISQ